MKNPIYFKALSILAICLLTIFSFGFKPAEDRASVSANPFAKEIDKKFVRIQKGLYVSKYETSVKDWLQFTNELTASGSKIAGLDYNQAAWQQFPWMETDPMVKLYMIKSQYKTFPIINITFEGAKQYCEWLTKKYKESDGKKFKNAQFVLPTDEEWIAATATPKGKDLPFKASSMKDELGRYYANVKYEGDDGGISYDMDGVYTVTNVNNSRFGAGSSLGLVHLFGNVAEMIDVEGQAKGGSWESFAKESGISKNQLYEGPDPRVGFRVFIRCEE